MSTIRKKDLVRMLSKDIYNFEGYEEMNMCSRFCDSLVKTIYDILRNGDDIRWDGFITISTIDKDERQGRDPTTGKIVTYPPSKGLRVRVSKRLKDVIKYDE